MSLYFCIYIWELCFQDLEKLLQARSTVELLRGCSHMKTLASSQQTLNNSNGLFIISNWSTLQTTVIVDTPPQCSSPVFHSWRQLYIHREGFWPPLFSSSEEEVDRAEGEVIPPPLHTVAFKVMGTTKIAGAQGVLEARDVPLQIIPEPQNPVDKMQSHLNVGLIVSSLSLDRSHRWTAFYNAQQPCYGCDF